MVGYGQVYDLESGAGGLMADGITVKLQGMEELLGNIQRLGTAYDRAKAEADLMVAVQPILAGAIGFVPYGPPTVHLRENIIAVPNPEIAEAKGDLATVSIGPTKAGFYGRFLEFGTYKMSARTWLRPAVDMFGGDTLAKLGTLIKGRILAVVH